MKFTINNYKITTRQCKKTDYDFIFGIVKKTIFPFVAKYYAPSKEMFDERFYKDYKEKIILCSGKREIGYYQLTPSKNILNITGIFLLPQYQGKGIGKYFMEYFETLGFNGINLQVWENNPAYKFYKKLGYKVVAKKKHKYFMEKKLVNKDFK